MQKFTKTNLTILQKYANINLTILQKLEVKLFKRKIYNRMLEWKKTYDGKSALLIEGPRRVGISTIVEQFAKNEYDSYILIDFYTASQQTKKLFDDLSDIDYIISALQLEYKTSLTKRKSVIVFDEVQLCPKARGSIKALVKDGRFDYIETGSLISIRKNVKDILIPSEEHKLKMYPFDYEEFRWALGDNVTSGLLHSYFENLKPFGQDMHRKLMRDFNLYMLVGGMPQAVDAYVNTRDFNKVDLIKRDILSLYLDDFRKIDPSGKISMLFKSIPAQLMGNKSRFNVSSVIKSTRANNVLEQITQLNDSGTVNVAYHANDPNAGLSHSINLEKFKLYVADTGLFITLAFMDKEFVDNEIYSDLLFGRAGVNLGYVYENVVAQTIVSNGKSLYYYTFLNEKSRHNYEIDFILTSGRKICPIEVKSSSHMKHASLDAFFEKYSSRIATKYLLSKRDCGKDKDVVCLPIYMTQFL